MISKLRKWSIKIETEVQSLKRRLYFSFGGKSEPVWLLPRMLCSDWKVSISSLKQVLYRTLYPRNTRALVWYSSSTHWLLFKCLSVFIYFTPGLLRASLCLCCQECTTPRCFNFDYQYVALIHVLSSALPTSTEREVCTEIKLLFRCSSSIYSIFLTKLNLTS